MGPIQDMITVMQSMPDIERYRFGRMVIDGTPVTRDLIILPGGEIIHNWRRDRGHFLSAADIDPLINEPVDIIVVGKGAFGLMNIDPGLPGSLPAGITIIGRKTSKAIDEYREAVSKDLLVGACFHLTC